MGFRVVIIISRVISPGIWVISMLTLLITPLITTHEPPSRISGIGSGKKMEQV